MQQSPLGGKNALPRIARELLCPATNELSYNLHLGRKAILMLLQSDLCGWKDP